LLVFAILFAQLAVWGSFFSYQNLRDTGGELTVPATLQQQQGRVPRTVRCNDLLSGDPARQPTDLDAQVTAGLAAQCRAQAATLPYIPLTAFVTVLARSSAAGMAIGLGYYFAEQLIVALLTNFFSWFQNVADYLLVRNISGWTGGAGGFPGTVLPDQTHAIVV